MAAKNLIFLSYSHLDAEIATELASRLEDAKIPCFLAERDVSVAQQWEPRIRDEIRKAACVVLLLTPRSIDSKWVAIETGAAWVLEKDIVPATMFIGPEHLQEPIRRYRKRFGWRLNCCCIRALSRRLQALFRQALLEVLYELCNLSSCLDGAGSRAGISGLAQACRGVYTHGHPVAAAPGTPSGPGFGSGAGDIVVTVSPFAMRAVRCARLGG